MTAHEALAASVRRLIDATIRTEVDAEAIAVAKDKIDSATAQLNESLMPGSFGIRCTADGQYIAWGNVVIGQRNPVAPPLVIHDGADGAVHTDFVLGAAYEGPPGHVHGGVCALILDHVLGATAHQPGRPAVTGTLTLRYLRGTPLGQPLRSQAHVDRMPRHTQSGISLTPTASPFRLRACSSIQGKPGVDDLGRRNRRHSGRIRRQHHDRQNHR